MSFTLRFTPEGFSLPRLICAAGADPHIGPYGRQKGEISLEIFPKKATFLL